MSAAAEKLKNDGNKYFKNKDYEKAIRSYSEAIELEPGNHVYYSNRAACYLAIKKYMEAEEDGLECIRLDKTFLKGYHRAANAQINLGNYVEAEKTLHAGLKYNADDSNLLALLRLCTDEAAKQKKELMSNMAPAERMKTEGNELFKQSRFPEAIEAYTKALGHMVLMKPLDELAISCYNNRAACYQQLGNYEKVVEDTTKVIDSDPKNMKALLRRGLAFENLEQFERALEDIRCVLMQNPNVEVANKAQHRLGNAIRMKKKSI